ncbi:MAG TPA: IPT/TIG domain-containing protein, partial [Streptosporangiaceae bacterium]|nr:IPT/TIG domain-containing protein [Streptosporangiaceae bacterium]
AGPSIGGRTITVTGSNFTAGNIAVSFGGPAGTSISVLSPNTLTVTTPGHGAGTVDVQVTSIGGTSALHPPNDQYQFMDQGYWIVESNGVMHSFNAALNAGGPTWSQRPISGMVETPDGRGYWVVAQDGGVFCFGDAGFYGSEAGVALNRPVVGIAATPDGGGYWLVAADGGVFTFGDAGFYGSTANVALNRPISGMATTTTGRGYWLVAQDGGIFTFGDAVGWGTYCCVSTRTMVGMAAPDNGGYWEAQDDGGVFPIGDAAQGLGSMGGRPLNRPVFGMASSPSGRGYWLFAQDGGVFPFGDAIGYGAASVGTAAGAAALFAA